MLTLVQTNGVFKTVHFSSQLKSNFSWELTQLVEKSYMDKQEINKDVENAVLFFFLKYAC